MAGRLARARELLRRRLVRRGVTLTVAAFAAALAVPTAPAALTGLIQSTIQTAKLFAAAQSTNALLSPRIVALAEGVLKAMYWTRVKIVMMVLLVAGLGGAGATFWAAPRSVAEPPRAAAAARPKAADAEKADDAKKLVRNMAISRLNLKKVVLAMHGYADANKGSLPPPAVVGKDGKDRLSWRVLLLPYLGERDLYEQFKLSEPWDSPHNKKLLSKMPKVFAPPGVTTRQPHSTFYQIFVSPKPKVGNAPEAGWLPAAFIDGQQMRFPASFTDGLANTILIIEAGNAVPWTKPDDLPYPADKPLPKLGGMFRDVIQAAFANGDTHTLTKQYDEFNLRAVITSSGGEVMDFGKIEARSAAADCRRKNLELRQKLEDAQDRLRPLKEELDALHGRVRDTKGPPDADSRLEELKKENARLQKELEKMKAEVQNANDEIGRLLLKPAKKKAP